MAGELFRLQGFVLDELAALGLQDRDGFSAQVAQLYLARRPLTTSGEFLKIVAAVRTTTFAPKKHQRSEVTAHLLKVLDRRYLARLNSRTTMSAPTSTKAKKIGVLASGARRASGRNQFHELMLEFRTAVRLNGIAGFWHSRSKGQLKPKPESIAQQALAMFLHMPIKGRSGIVLEEVRSGTGYVDVMALFGSKSYVVELKILKTKTLRGVQQLADYLDLHSLAEGWLIVFDARATKNRVPLPDDVQKVNGKTINLLFVDINPVPPSSKK